MSKTLRGAPLCLTLLMNEPTASAPSSTSLNAPAFFDVWWCAP
jgi:hypothetical protein